MNKLLTEWMKDPPRSIEVDPYKVCLDQLFGKVYKPDFDFGLRRQFEYLRIDSGPNSGMIISIDSELGKHIIGTSAFELTRFPIRVNIPFGK